MALQKAKPTSAGRRFTVTVKTPELHKGKPLDSLLAKKHRKGGRNNAGRITTRHQGGGHKQRYRLVDFRRDKDGVPGVVERLEYDPNRSAHLALVKYADGERRYILAPKGVEAGAQILSGEDAPIKAGNALPLKSIPVGTTVHCVEMKPGKGGQLARSAGAGVQIAAREGAYATLRLRSGESRRIHVECRATIGDVGHGEHNLRKLGKAGAMRWLGVRRRAYLRRPPPGQPLGQADQRLQDPVQQADGQDDRPSAQEEVSRLRLRLRMTGDEDLNQCHVQ